MQDACSLLSPFVIMIRPAAEDQAEVKGRRRSVMNCILSVKVLHRQALCNLYLNYLQASSAMCCMTKVEKKDMPLVTKLSRFGFIIIVTL